MELMQTFKSAGYQFITFAEWCEKRTDLPQKFIILRHDIDKNPKNALKVAHLDHQIGIQSTFYWLASSPVYRPSIIKKVFALGHEIGYHYRDWVDAGGNPEMALKLFDFNLRKLRDLVPVKTIAMDGCPWSSFDNRDLWKDNDYKAFGIIGEPYIDLFGAHGAETNSDVYYMTDTGRMWDGEQYSVRDKVNDLQINDYHSTKELIAGVLSAQLPNRIMITTHPQRWTDNWIDWTIERVMQWLKNHIKKGFYN